MIYKTISPFIGQRYSTSDMKLFEIKDLTVGEDDAWVEYASIDTQQSYSCRLEAFRHRFTPVAE